MIHTKGFAVLAALAMTATMSATGCGSPTPPANPPQAGPAPSKPHAADHGHDHGDHAHAATLAEGLEQLQKALATITTSLATGAKGAADEAVHEVGHILIDLEELLEKQELTTEVKATGRKALAELTECFDKLDQALHAAEGEGESALNVLGSVTERIGKAIVSLGELMKTDSTSNATPNKEAP